MKKLTYLFAILTMFAAIVSCSKETTRDNELDLLKKATVITARTASSPISDGVGVTPYLIPGSNKGGNRTCAEVATAFNLETNPFLCGEKIDYDDGAFLGAFPEGLNVTTDGVFVSFDLADCIMIGDKYYKVGAVIVKGSDQANVYYYYGGILSDNGLASPINSSGSPAGLSNLTFCFVECEVPVDLVVGFKSYVTGVEDAHVTTGEFITAYPLALGGSYPVYLWGGASAQFLVGYLTIADSNNDGYWEITIDNSVRPEFQYIEPFLYVGTAEDFSLDFRNYPYPDPKVIIDPPMDTWTFVLPFLLP